MNARNLFRLAVAGTALLLGRIAVAEEPGRRVQIAVNSGELPDVEAMVDKITTPEGEHEVRVKAEKTAQGTQLKIDLWGSALANADIPTALRTAFPQLASADIRVEDLPPGSKPLVEPDLEKGKGRKVIVKKTITDSKDSKP